MKDIIAFFVELFELEKISFPRSLWPRDAEVEGQPDLVLFSDGSTLAFGSVAYIRWRLNTGRWWSMLMFSKSKIAPKSRITVPRLELNGAVLSKRLSEFAQSHLDHKFGNVYHLVDSSTVLGYLHKQDAKLKPFEGIRVSEVQAAGTFVEGRLLNWSWVESGNNPADYTTKPRKVAELTSGGFWQKGPGFLEEDVSKWPVKFDFRTDRLEGELQPKGVFMVSLSMGELSNKMNSLLEKFSSSGKLFRIIAYCYKWKLIGEDQSTRVVGMLSKEVLMKSMNAWIRFVQVQI